MTKIKNTFEDATRRDLEPTTIIWVTLPSKGNQGAAIIKWRETTYDTAPYRGRIVGDYLLGLMPARYPVPAIQCLPFYERLGHWAIFPLFD